MMLGKEETYKLIEQLLWIIEDYFILASTPKTYGTETRFHRLDIHLIDTIGKNEGINVTEIARVHKITKSAVSQAVKKLEQRGFVKRYKAPENRKEVLFRLTESGKAAFDAHLSFHDLVEKPFAAELAKITPEEASGIYKLVEALKRRADLVRKLENE